MRIKTYWQVYLWRALFSVWGHWCFAVSMVVFLTNKSMKMLQQMLHTYTTSHILWMSNTVFITDLKWWLLTRIIYIYI